MNEKLDKVLEAVEESLNHPEVEVDEIVGDSDEEDENTFGDLLEEVSDILPILPTDEPIPVEETKDEATILPKPEEPTPAPVPSVTSESQLVPEPAVELASPKPTSPPPPTPRKRQLNLGSRNIEAKRLIPTLMFLMAMMAIFIAGRQSGWTEAETRIASLDGQLRIALEGKASVEQELAELEMANSQMADQLRLQYEVTMPRLITESAHTLTHYADVYQVDFPTLVTELQRDPSRYLTAITDPNDPQPEIGVTVLDWEQVTVFLAGQNNVIYTPVEPVTEVLPVAFISDTETTYVVVAGDTLSSIAERYGVDLTELRFANSQIEDADVINPGDVITIPQPRSTLVAFASTPVAP